MVALRCSASVTQCRPYVLVNPTLPHSSCTESFDRSFAACDRTMRSRRCVRSAAARCFASTAVCRVPSRTVNRSKEACLNVTEQKAERAEFYRLEGQTLADGGLDEHLRTDLRQARRALEEGAQKAAGERHLHRGARSVGRVSDLGRRAQDANAARAGQARGELEAPVRREEQTRASETTHARARVAGGEDEGTSFEPAGSGPNKDIISVVVDRTTGVRASRAQET